MTQRRMTAEEFRARLSGRKVKAQGIVRERGSMNKTEQRYADHLKLLGLPWKFESIKLRLADKTWYTPDFEVINSASVIELHEVKGFWRDRDRVRVKVAAEQYPEFRFVAARWVKKQWEIEEF